MSKPPSIHSKVSLATKASFVQHIREHPNSRRVSRAEKENLIRWLTDIETKPSSQKESSRRNYVRRTFTWDENAKTLFAAAKKNEKNAREVVTEDMIPDVVGFVHENNGHAGWDTTWEDVSKLYYGVLRIDVIFILKRCEKCAQNPRKRAKGWSNMLPDLLLIDQDVDHSPDFDELQVNNSGSDEPVNEGNQDGL